MRCGYTFGMKIAVSIPDDLFLEAEKVAQEHELSRSALYAKALREHLARLKDEAVTAQMNASLARFPDEHDPFMNEVARHAMKRDGVNW
jgi:metal-responsive CopG/Arc/MetJ family transcriptional regulator